MRSALPFATGALAALLLSLAAGGSRAADTSVLCGPAPTPAPGEPRRITYVAPLAPRADSTARAAQTSTSLPLDFAIHASTGMYGYDSCPIATAALDADGDGALDLAVADSYQHFLALLFNDAESPFTRRDSLELPGRAFDVQAGDLDGDGLADLVCSLWDTGQVAVLRNLGGGSFAPAVTYPAGVEARGVVLADLDGDGDLDVAVASFTGNTVRILRNRGDGTFALGSEEVVGSGPMTLLAADANGDGWLDLVTADAGCTTVSCLLNRGDGTFLPRVQSRTPDVPYALAAADFDGDGNLDLVTSGPSRCALLLGDGTGRFAPGPLPVAAGDWEHAGAAAADLDGDGRADLLLAEPGRSGGTACFGLVRVYRNLGGGRFERRLGYHAVYKTQSLRLADLDGDGHPDVLATGLGYFLGYRAGVTVLRGREGMRLRSVSEQPVDSLAEKGGYVYQPSWTRAVTLRGDGIADLIMNSGERVLLSLNRGERGFDPPVVIGQGAIRETRDLDQDGLSDLIVARNDTLEVRLGRAARGFGPAVATLRGAFVAAGDFNGDHHDDIALADSSWAVLIAPGDGRGGFGAPFPSGARLLPSAPGCCTAADLDQDGRADLLVARRDGPNGEAHLVVFRGGPQGTLDSTANYALPDPQGGPSLGWSPAPIQVLASDLDRDGWPDVFTLHYSSWSGGFFSTLVNRGDGTLESRQCESAAMEPSEAVLADFDEDGDPDGVIADINSDDTGALYFLTGRGDGTFDVECRDDAGDYITAITAGRFNSDRHLDLAWPSVRAVWFGIALNSLGPDVTTPTLASLVEAVAEPGAVRITWEARASTGRVLRSEDGLEWTERARLVFDGNGRAQLDDREVLPGRRYGYRLMLDRSGTSILASEVWLEVPQSRLFGLAGAWPNPTEGDLVVGFGLPDAAPAKVELFDLAGRRLVAREVGRLGRGEHRLRLAESGALPSGVYFVRLERGREARTARVLVLR